MLVVREVGEHGVVWKTFDQFQRMRPLKVLRWGELWVEWAIVHSGAKLHKSFVYKYLQEIHDDQPFNRLLLILHHTLTSFLLIFIFQLLFYSCCPIVDFVCMNQTQFYLFHSSRVNHHCLALHLFVIPSSLLILLRPSDHGEKASNWQWLLCIILWKLWVLK